MTRFLRALRLAVAASLLGAGSAALAATPALTDEMLSPLTAAYVQAVQPGEQADLHRDLFAPVLRRVQRSHARDVDMPAMLGAAMKVIESHASHSGDPAEVFRSAMNAALASLDPHSRYLDARAESNQRSAISGAFGGLGLEVETVDGLLRVIAPMEGAPAARAGLQRGDLIVRFDDQPTAGMALGEAIARIRGQPGTTITLTIRRPGLNDDFSVALVRETIRTQAVRWKMEGDVLVLRLATFTRSVAAALQKAITDASAAATPSAVILDMRGNGGGLFREAVTISDLFLSEGAIVSLKGRTSGNQGTWKADPAEQLSGVPMVVLIDGRSASASELVAAALQENGRAIVMGQRSFGKGSVQSTVSLGADKGALRLTTAVYYGPSGRTLQRTGVGPDIELLGPDGTAPRAARREADRAQALPGVDEPPPPKARVEQSRCTRSRNEPDPALACALAFVRAGEIDAFVAALPPESAERP